MSIARVLAVTLTFVCVGPLIQIVCYAILSGAAGLVDWIIGLSLPIGRPALIWFTVWAGLTGLIAGVCDAMAGRVKARTMLVVSLVMALADLILFMWILAPMFISLYVHLHARDPDPMALWLPVATRLFCFVVSMMACWKLIDIVRSKTSAAGSLTPT
jgi:hypothetical protein